MKISLVGPSYTLQSVVAAAQQTINWYPETLAVQDEPRRQVLFGRPGLKFFAQLSPTKIRCLWSGGGRLFAVHAANLSEISEAGAITTQPTVMFQGSGNPDPAQIFSNGHQLMIITGGLVYIDNGTGPQPARFAESGTASTTATVGNNVHRLTGPPFNPATMSSRTMRMNGNFYVVNAVIDANNITVSPTPTASPETVWSIDSGANVDAVTGGFLDGYFIVNRTRSANPALQAQGRTFNISALNDGTFWDPLDFAVKEGYSDYIQSILCDHEELILFGTETTEVWTNIGSTIDASGVASFPFQRMQGAFNNDGSAVIYAPCSVGPYRCWLGSGTNGQTVAYRALAFSPERISTHAQESNWNAPSFNVKDAVSYAYLDDGHLFWVINFWAQSQTWVYDMSEGLWHERAAWVPASSTFARYQPWFHAFVPEWGIGGKHIVGDPATGKLYEQSLNFYDDDGVAIEYIRSFPHLLNEDKNMFHHRIEFYLETGAVTGVIPEMQIGLDWSDDRGHTFKTGLAPLQTSGATGDYRKRIVWRRLGRSRDRIYRFGVQGKGKVCLTDAFLEATPGES